MTLGRNIRLFLADGTPSGIITAEIMNWTGHVIVAPRSRLADLVQRDEAGRTGVYILTGPDPEGGFTPMVYIGESDNVGKRLAQHNKDDSKAFWEQTCIITSKDQNLTKAHVRYLESKLISISANAGRCKLSNGTAPEYGLLPEADLSDMEFFIDQLRVVLPVLGLDIIKEPATALIFSRQSTQSNLGEPVTDIPLGPETGNEVAEVNSRVRPSRFGTTSPEFILRDDKLGLVAKAVEVNGEMVILKGSTARKDEGISLSTSLRQHRKDLVSAGILRDYANNQKLFVFTDDVALNSPSQSSAIILARSDNGRLSWHIPENGKTYADWQQEQVAAAAPSGGEE